jgi:hypothetical protein
MSPRGVAPKRMPKAEATTELAPKKASACALWNWFHNGAFQRACYVSTFFGEVSRGAEAFGIQTRRPPGAVCPVLRISFCWLQLVAFAIATACLSVGLGRSQNVFIHALFPPAFGARRGCALTGPDTEFTGVGFSQRSTRK